MRVLVTLMPAMYRQTIALFLKEQRPSAEVETTVPANADREVELFEPHLVVSSALPALS